MKRNIYSIIIMLALTLCANAQESIEHLYSEYSKESIIREINHGEWLVYSAPGFCDFSKVVAGNTTVDILRLPEYIVSVADFEIYDGKVYVCGMLNCGLAYLGYFELSSFPYSNFVHIKLDNIVNIKKLEVLPIENTDSGPLCQVIMTGTDGDGTGTIIDAVPYLVGWDIFKIYTHHTDYYNPDYEDVAIIDNYVVITSCDCEFIDVSDMEPKCTGSVWYFSKPLSAATPLVSSTIAARKVHYTPTRPFLITKGEDSTFFTATQSYLGNIYVSEFSGLSIVGTAILQTNSDILKDITYYISGHSTEVLVDRMEDQLYESAIYTVLPPMYLLPSAAWGHIFRHNVLNSLRHYNHNNYHFIGSGYINYECSELYLYRYASNTIVQECAITTKINTTPSEKIYNERPFEFDYFFCRPEPIVGESIYKVTSLKNKCGETKIH